MKLWRMFTSIGLDESLKRSPCVLRLRLPPRAAGPRPPFPGVASPINRTLRFVDSCVYAVGGAFIRRNLCRYTHTDVYMHPLCIRTCTARVYAPTCGRKRTKHRVQAHTRKRGVGCVNAPIRVYAPFGDATNVMGRNRSNHVGYAPPAPNHLVSPLRHLRLRTISSPRFVTCVSAPSRLPTSPALPLLCWELVCLEVA